MFWYKKCSNSILLCIILAVQKLPCRSQKHSPGFAYLKEAHHVTFDLLSQEREMQLVQM